jgi:anti-sigma factor RsiW
MSCERIQDRFADYLTGDLNEGARREIQDHISSCAACRTEIENLTAIWAKLGVLPQAQPSGDLRHRFYSMLEAYKNEMDAAGKTSARARLLSRWREWFTFRRPAFAASFSTFLLLMGIGTGWLVSGSGGKSARLSSLQREVQDMRQTVALSLLSQPSASERLQGISYSAAVRNPKAQTLAALVNTLNTDPNPNVRLAAAEALYLFRDQPGVRDCLTSSLAVQSSPLVQVALIDLLVEIREQRASEALKALIKNEKLNPDVKKLAEQGIKQLI